MMKSFLTAFQFLTVIKLSRQDGITGATLGRSLAWFPMVGLILGLVISLVRLLSVRIFPVPVANILAISVLVLITGAIHQDGFADMVDGLAGGGDRERTLAIMKDSRIGSFGVMGLILLFALKIAAMAGIPEGQMMRALIVMPVLGRWSTVFLAIRFPYARTGPGTAKMFMETAGLRELAEASGTALILAVFFLGFRGMVISGMVVLFTLAFGFHFKKHLGGVTGDIMGAANEINEVLVLLFFCASMHW